MAWQEEMTAILRTLIGDLDATVFTDDRLQTVLAVAAFQVKRELYFETDYSISVGSASISPDPTLTTTKDDSFVNLTCLKAAAITDKGSAIQATRRAISVKDGSSAIDLRGPLQGWIALLESDGGWSSAYEKAKAEYQTGQSVAGMAVMTPFRTWASAYYLRDTQDSIERLGR